MRTRYVAFWTALLLVLPAEVLAKERLLKGRVWLVGEHDELTPAGSVTVTVEPSGDSARTTKKGEFRVPLPDWLRTGQRVTISVEKPNWVVQYPLDGETHIPADLRRDLVEVRLLPKGSKKLWAAERIAKFIQDTAGKAKEQITRDGKPEDIDFSRYIKDWAVKYGFSAKEAKAQIDKWVGEVEKKQDDLFKLGLAAYAKKNFGEARKLLRVSAEHKAKQLKEVKEKGARLTEEIVQGFRTAGDAAYNEYAFDDALTDYERALQYVAREETPRLWTEVLMDVGKANSQIGIRAEGPAVHQHLTSAAAAYRAALEVRTRKQLPQEWAATQNNLGATLRDQAIRTGGEEGRRLLAEAVAAYRAALEVRTRKQLPQDWAMTQNNLGIALRDQAIRTGGEERRRLLAEAVAAYRAALGVRTRDALQPQWAQTQKNLAEAYVYLEDWPNAAASYANVLRVDPDYVKGFRTASFIYHDKLFAFSDAFTLNQKWLERYPHDISALSDFAEKHFTTGRFAEAETRLAELLERPDLEPRTSIALRALDIATLAALRKTEPIPGKIEKLREAIANQPEDFKLTWSFDGTTYFISNDERLAPSRVWLLDLLSALKKEDRNSILVALDTARTNLLVTEKD